MPRHNNFTNLEMRDMLCVYSQKDYSCLAVARRYREMYPNRVQPNRQTFSNIFCRLGNTGQFKPKSDVQRPKILTVDQEDDILSAENQNSQIKDSCTNSKEIGISNVKSAELLNYSDTETSTKNEPPVQTALIKNITVIQQEIIGLKTQNNNILLTSEEYKNLKEKQCQLMQQNKKILNLKKRLKIRETTGQPRKKIEQLELLKTIIDIATHGAATDDRRRSEQLRSIKTLDELMRTLKNNFGFNISQSAVYLHLLSGRVDSTKGK
ncbi:hypothetical protein ILUMI_09108 [Ignelater luminosus]|uniref:DUF4817 domain-containing protein n=1 Tax=Ignelater luminosus TaxID=2038154 RepID=A0A8K0D4Y4_IGNLU|nr:hypothetical protein ILUMI_09108 [Ignelater luminosus]